MEKKEVCGKGFLNNDGNFAKPYTVDLEIFVVKIFSWAALTTKIKNEIILQRIIRAYKIKTLGECFLFPMPSVIKALRLPTA